MANLVAAELTALLGAHWKTALLCALLAFIVLRLYAFATGDSDMATARAVRRLHPESFRDQVVWIVGASTGIGEALAYELAKRGATLVLSARRMDRLLQVQNRCHELGCPELEILRMDALDLTTHAALAEHVIRKYKKIDILVNNAGRSQRGLAEKTPVEVDVQMFQLNVFAVLSLTKAVLPRMLAAGKGHIVNTSSIAARTGNPIAATYSATKAAINGFFGSLRMEVGYRGISVTNVCPGPVATDLTLHAFTEEVGKPLNQLDEGSRRMPAERCALLMAGAIAAKLPESWIAEQPVLFYAYLATYAPSLYAAISTRVGAKRVQALKQGDTTYKTLQSGSSVLSALFKGTDASKEQ